MRNNYYLLAFCAFLGVNTVHAQRGENFDRDFQQIKKELTSWDPVRGEWLSSSITAIADQSEVPSRNFPESITPNQMIAMVPSASMQRVRAIADGFANDNANQDAAYWGQVRDIVSRNRCSSVSGRSYGDPHLQSFDGARYSFQTVGEFVLAKSNDGQVEVQTRQKARRDDFSLNTAVAMNVGGDRVCIYAEDVPGGSSSPVQVNGQSVELNGRPYFLANGGTVRFENRMYIVDWPTGESASAQVRSNGSMDFLNVSFNVFPCTNGGYNGLMGNANGMERDDFNTSRGIAPVRFAGTGMATGNSTKYIQEQRAAYLAKEFADEHRISQATSLFDYPIGTSTFTFTDRTFPRVFRSIDDLDDDRRNRARRNCESNGISGRDLNGCIYDNAFLDIPPTPRHVVPDPTEGIIIREVDGRVPNTNKQPYPIEPIKSTKGGTIFDNEPVTPVKTDVEQKGKIDEELEKPSRGADTKIGTDEPTKTSTPIRTTPIRTTPTRKSPTRTSFPRTNTPKPPVSRPTPTRRPSTPRPSPTRKSSPKPSPSRIGGRGF